MFLKILIFKILYFLKICQTFVGSVLNFGRSDSDIICWKMLIFTRCIHGFMSNLIKKSLKDSKQQPLKASSVIVVAYFLPPIYLCLRVSLLQCVWPLASLLIWPLHSGRFDLHIYVPKQTKLFYLPIFF